MANQLSPITLVLGGIKSGKSRHARERAETTKRSVKYLATARREDPEMARRIEAHRERRPDDWRTLEPGFDIGEILDRSRSDSGNLWLLDDFSLLISDWMDEGRSRETILEEIHDFSTQLQTVREPWIIVSALSGRTLVPTRRESRRFLDILGKSNQFLADVASRVDELTAGIAQTLKDERNQNDQNISDHQGGSDSVG